MIIKKGDHTAVENKARRSSGRGRLPAAGRAAWPSRCTPGRRAPSAHSGQRRPPEATCPRTADAQRWAQRSHSERAHHRHASLNGNAARNASLGEVVAVRTSSCTYTNLPGRAGSTSSLCGAKLMGPPPCVPSIIDRNITPRRVTVFSKTIPRLL